MSCETPRRISLRKRNKSEIKDGSQVKRKSSSTTNQNKKAHPSDSTPDHVSVEHHHRVLRVSPQTPKSHRRKTKKATYMKRPATYKESVQVSNPEVSPTSPFSLSQMPCTQECEVVWDCNSPGYSKEDLKKMCNKMGDKTFTPSPIAPLPKQPLLTHIRPPDQMWARDGGSSTSTMVAATLDDLLAKVNSEHLKLIENEKLSCENINESFNDSNLFKSSQPFEVSNLEPNFSFSDGELEEVTCLDNQDAGSPHTTNQTKMNGDFQVKPPTVSPVRGNVFCKETQIVPKRKGGIKCRETNGNFSPSDDYFNESFLKVTQAIEDDFFAKASGTSHHPSTKTTNLPLSPLSRIRTKKPVVLFPKLDKSSKREESMLTCKATHDHLRSSVTVLEKQREFLTNKKTEKSCLQGKQGRSSTKTSVNLDASKVTTDNNNVDKKTTSKVAGLRMSFQLEGINAPSREKNVPQNSNIFHQDKKLSKESCDKTSFTKEKNNLKIKRFPIHQAELTQLPSLGSCMNTTRHSPIKWLTGIQSASKPTNPAVGQQVSIPKGKNVPIKSHLVLVTDQPLENPFKAYSQELDEDDFAAMMPSLIKIEEEYSLRNADTGMNVPKLVNNASKASSNEEEDPFLMSCPPNHISSTENVSESFKRNLFSRSPLNSFKNDASNMTHSNKVTLNSLSKSPKECTKMSSALSEGICTAGSTKSGQNFDNVTGVKSKVIDLWSNLPNQLETNDQADDGFGDDDDLFLQEDVLESINLIESQYMASQKTSVKNSPSKPTSVCPNTSSPLFRSGDYFPSKSSKPSEVSSSFNTIPSKKKVGPFGNPRSFIPPIQSMSATKEKEKHNFRKEQFCNHIDTTSEGAAPEGKETLPVAPPEGGVSDDDLLKMIFEKNPFEDEFDLPMTDTKFPSPDFGKPFKPPTFVNSKSTSNFIARTFTSRNGHLKVNKYPLSTTTVSSEPSVPSRLTHSTLGEAGSRTTAKNLCNSKPSNKEMTSNISTWDRLNSRVLPGQSGNNPPKARQ